MTAVNPEGATGQEELIIKLAADHVSVSSLSSLLRAVQAALRDVAEAEVGVASHFLRRPQPILRLSQMTMNHELVMRFTFADPLDSSPLPDLSARTFRAFMNRFGGFLKGLPQPGLWGASSRGTLGRQYHSELEQRMDEVRAHVRRFHNATLIFEEHEIHVQGEHMEIS